MSLAAILVLVAFGVIAWKLGGFILGALAWFLVAVMALSLLVGEPVPGGVPVVVVALWFGSQVISRAKAGSWRSQGLERLFGAVRNLRTRP